MADQIGRGDRDAPNTNCRSDANQSGFLVNRAATPPAISRPTPPHTSPGHSDSKPSRYGISGTIAPMANMTNDDPAAMYGDGFSDGSTPSS